MYNEGKKETKTNMIPNRFNFKCPKLRVQKFRRAMKGLNKKERLNKHGKQNDENTRRVLKN
jgi:hypothetical protein